MSGRDGRNADLLLRLLRHSHDMSGMIVLMFLLIKVILRYTTDLIRRCSRASGGGGCRNLAQTLVLLVLTISVDTSQSQCDTTEGAEGGTYCCTDG